MPVQPAPIPVPDPSCATLDQLEDGITCLAAHIYAAESQFLTLIAEFDRRHGWGVPGVTSMVHWLGWKCGMAAGTARDRLRVAHALERLPQIAGSFERGEVSYSKVRAMTRIANAENEADLLYIAHHGTAAHIEKLVRATRRAQSLNCANHAYAQRSVRWYSDVDGSVCFRMRLPAEMGDVLIQAMDQVRMAMQPDWMVPLQDNEDPPEPDDPPAARWADAIAALAESSLGRAVRAGGGDVWQMVVHHTPASAATAATPQVGVSAETACRPAGSESGSAETERFGAIPEEAAERIACDAAIVDMTEDADGNVLDVGRKRRSVPPAMRRALQRRDGGCRFPGCTNHLFVDAHHIQHWSHGGATSMDNLILTCRRHHRLLHEGGWHIIRGEGPILPPVIGAEDTGVTFVRPDGTIAEPAFDLKRWLASERSNDPVVVGLGPGALPAVSAETIINRWCGESMDYNTAIDGVLGLNWFERRQQSPP